MSLCARLCRTRQNRRDTIADDPNNQPPSYHRQLLGQPVAALVPTGHRQPRAFPIGSTQHPAASSLGGFPTRADVDPSPNPRAAARIEKPSMRHIWFSAERSAFGARGRLVRSAFRLPYEAREGSAGVERRSSSPRFDNDRTALPSGPAVIVSERTESFGSDLGDPPIWGSVTLALLC